MPELPEVETIVRFLRPKIRGKRILSMEIRGRRVARGHKNPQELNRAVAGRKISEVNRTGKNIILELSGGARLAIHLMMTGRLFWNPKEKQIHDRLVLKLSGGNDLVFNDIRQFGWCRVLKPSGKLAGPDVLSLGFNEFKSLVSPRPALIKNLLLNQKVISGIGNIYSDEILWYACLRPTRRANTFSGRELKKFYQAMRHVLLLAIKKEGTSSRDYRKPDGTEGGYYKIRKAYQRAGKQCLRDGATIKRIKIGSRSAHFCPKHQK
ncbi:MAG: DNA-formamidopyrimidine glycosylase [Candidatus Sungiibacteriota bacterium]|uniref:DNA-formamidopyrimidine glycosylase n=1 Tax=Candidatus Sungiibacteriota bacterium TaxID=2750080 RepID=A0A7T5RIQ9_9BACT|nr:MAG: DNA-formamidopyrimidine glycosylase [Candidatus Sungbacteria bacterium]